MLKTRQARWWQLKLNKAGVPNGKLMRFPELMYHPQTRDNGYMVEQDTAHWGRFFSGGLPWQFSRTPAIFDPPTCWVKTHPTSWTKRIGCRNRRRKRRRTALMEITLATTRSPLAGLRVIELAQGIAGPYAAHGAGRRRR